MNCGSYLRSTQLPLVALLFALTCSVQALESPQDLTVQSALPAALQIAQAMQDIEPLWMEDVIRPDNIETIAQFRHEAGVPIAVSEMLVTRD